MRTPTEAFKSMCYCHGEIWTLTEKGSIRSTKDEHGKRVNEAGIMPLEVHDLLKVTGQRYAYRNWLLGTVEVLVSSSIKAKLNQEHSLAQIICEELRSRLEVELRRDYDEDGVLRHFQNSLDKLGRSTEKRGFDSPEDMRMLLRKTVGTGYGSN